MGNKTDRNYPSHNAAFKKYTTAKFAFEIQADYIIVQTIQYCF